MSSQGSEQGMRKFTLVRASMARELGTYNKSTASKLHISTGYEDRICTTCDDHGTVATRKFRSIDILGRVPRLALYTGCCRRTALEASGLPETHPSLRQYSSYQLQRLLADASFVCSSQHLPICIEVPTNHWHTCAYSVQNSCSLEPAHVWHQASAK
jgi:hypothetical protein